MWHFRDLFQPNELPTTTQEIPPPNKISVSSGYRMGYKWSNTTPAIQILRPQIFKRLIFTARNRSCGKVMFLHLSASHSVHGGGGGGVKQGHDFHIKINSISCTLRQYATRKIDKSISNAAYFVLFSCTNLLGQFVVAFCHDNLLSH